MEAKDIGHHRSLSPVRMDATPGQRRPTRHLPSEIAAIADDGLKEKEREGEKNKKTSALTSSFAVRSQWFHNDFDFPHRWRSLAHPVTSGRRRGPRRGGENEVVDACSTHVWGLGVICSRAYIRISGIAV